MVYIKCNKVAFVIKTQPHCDGFYLMPSHADGVVDKINIIATVAKETHLTVSILIQMYFVYTDAKHMASIR